MRKLSFGIGILAVLAVLWAAQSIQNQSIAAEPERILIEQRKSILDAESDVVVVDTRSHDNYENGHVPGAIVIAYPDEIRSRASEIPRDKIIILYCA